jgi:WD40 repeat protein
MTEAGGGPSGYHSVLCLAFAPDGKTLASGGGQVNAKGEPQPSEVVLWDPSKRTPAVRLKGHAGNVTALAFTPDGRMLASGGGFFSRAAEVKLWHVDAQKERDTLTGPEGPVRCLAFAEGGRALVAFIADEGGGWGALWKLGAGKGERLTPWQTGGMTNAALSADGQRLAVSRHDGTIDLFDPATGKRSGSLLGHKGSVMSLAFRPDGRTLISGGWDRSVRLWDVGAGKEL